MNNPIKLLAAVLLFGALFASCEKDPTTGPGPENPDGKTALPLFLTDAEQVETYSVATANERYISQAYALVFDAAGKYKMGAKALPEQIQNNNTSTPTITFDIKPTIGDRVVVLCNTGVYTIPESLKVGVSTVDDINPAFASGGWETNQEATNIGRGQPMSGSVVWAATAPSCTMYRASTKIQLTLGATLADNDLTGAFTEANVRWGMYNVVQQGNIYSSDGALSVPAVPTFANTTVNYTIAGAATGVTTLYMPEWQNSVKTKSGEADKTMFHPDRTCMLVRVENAGPGGSGPGFYRLDLLTGNGADETKDFIDIRRNHHYNVTINKVRSEGYPTAEAALASPASNIEYRVTETGDVSVVDGNGQYAISATKSLDVGRMLILANDDQEIELTQLKYILPAEMTALPAGTINKVTVEKVTAGTGGVNVVAVSVPTELTADLQPVRVRFTGAGTTTFDISVQLGNIKIGGQVLVVKSSIGMLDAHTTSLTLANAQVVTPGPTESGFYFWNSGANMVYYTPENVKPVKWTKSDGITPSDEDDRTAVPLFEEKYYDEYVDVLINEVAMQMRIIAFQKAPTYVGRFGTPLTLSESGYRKKRMIAENVEENSSVWQNGTTTSSVTPNYDNGLFLTGALSSSTLYYAARYCRNKNIDLNGNGSIDTDEIKWYLPAMLQMGGLWIIRNAFDAIPGTLPLNGDYWTSTENGSNGLHLSSSSGVMFTLIKTSTANMRCVRDL